MYGLMDTRAEFVLKQLVLQSCNKIPLYISNRFNKSKTLVICVGCFDTKNIFPQEEEGWF